MEVSVKGTVAPGFEPVRDTFQNLWAQIEVGAALCIYLRGEPVVDLWGGFQDRDLTKPWEADTLVNIYSATKGIASIAFAQLVDDGLLQYEDRVADYWPEFAEQGKGEITIAEALAHKGGLAGVDATLTVPDLYNWNLMTDLLAKQRPLWEPGTAAGYHAVTWGYLPGEIVRRVTGKTLGTWLQQRLSGPLSADVHLGLPDALHSRCATLIGPNHARIKSARQTGTDAPSPLFLKALQNPAITPFRDACSAPWRRAEIAASNGHATARGIARIYAAAAQGGQLDGTRILEPETLEKARLVEVDVHLGPDLVTGSVMRRSRGFILGQDGNYGPNSSSFGHAGAGGSLGFADSEFEVGFGYTMNQMQSDASEPRAKRLVETFYGCLKG